MVSKPLVLLAEGFVQVIDVLASRARLQRLLLVIGSRYLTFLLLISPGFRVRWMSFLLGLVLIPFVVVDPRVRSTLSVDELGGVR